MIVMGTVSAAPPTWTVDEALADETAWVFFRRYGFLILDQVFDAAEVQAIRDDATTLEQRTLRGDVPKHLRDEILRPSVDAGGHQRLHRLPYFTYMNERTSKLIDSRHFIPLGQQLLGVRPWMLFDTMGGAIWQLKLGGSSSYSSIQWHLDFPDYHPLSPVASAGIYLDDSTTTNGCLIVVPGSHRYPPTPRDRLEPMPVEVRAGDVVIHAHNLLHEGLPAAAGTRRATLYLYLCAGEYPGQWIPFSGTGGLRKVASLFQPGGKSDKFLPGDTS